MWRERALLKSPAGFLGVDPRAIFTTRQLFNITSPAGITARLDRKARFGLNGNQEPDGQVSRFLVCAAGRLTAGT